MIATARRYMTAIAGAALIAVTVSACGGGGPTTTVTPVDLGPVTPGFTAEAATLEIDAGDSVVHGDIEFSCAVGGDDCTVMVSADADGAVSVASTGGTVTATDSDDYSRRVRIREELSRLIYWATRTIRDNPAWLGAIAEPLDWLKIV